MYGCEPSFRAAISTRSVDGFDRQAEDVVGLPACPSTYPHTNCSYNTAENSLTEVTLMPPSSRTLYPEIIHSNTTMTETDCPTSSPRNLCSNPVSLTGQGLQASNASSLQSRKHNMNSHEAWESYKHLIHKYYIEQRLSLKSTAAIMREKHDFNSTYVSTSKAIQRRVP